MLVVTSHRTLSPRPLPTDPILNYHLQDAAAAVGPWLCSPISSLSPPFSSSYSLGADDRSPQASSSSTCSPPPAVYPALPSSSSYSITHCPPASELGGIMHPNSDEDSSVDEDALGAEPAHQQQHQQQHHHHQQPHPHQLPPTNTGTFLQRVSSRPVHDVHSAPAGLPSNYSSYPRGHHDSGSASSDFNHEGLQTPYLDQARKLVDPSSQTHPDAHVEHPYHHHRLPPGPPTAAPSSSLPTPPSHPVGGYEPPYHPPTSSAGDTYKHFQSLPESSTSVDHQPLPNTPPILELDPAILEAVRTKIEVKHWDEQKSLYFQKESKAPNGAVHWVGRVQETNMVNGTKLLNVTGISRGKRDGILKNEKKRKVVKHGTMHLKGVWITRERAEFLCEQYGIAHEVYPLLVPNLAQYINALQPTMSNTKLGPNPALHHGSKFANPIPFMNRTSSNPYPVEQQAAWTGSSHAINYPEPYSAPPQSGSGGSSIYEQAQYSYLNNPPGTDLAERRNTVPGSFTTFHGLSPFPSQPLSYPTPYPSNQFPSYSRASRPSPIPNSPSQFSYGLGSHPTSASGPTYTYPAVTANPGSVYSLGPPPPTSSSGTNQSSPPALHSSHAPASPPIRSPNMLETGSFGGCSRGQVESLKREADDDLLSGPSTDPSRYRRIQARISSDPSPHSFRQSAPSGPSRYTEWASSGSSAAAHPLSMSSTSADQLTSPSHLPRSLNPSQVPPPRSVSATNSSGHSVRAMTEESPSTLTSHSISVSAPGSTAPVPANPGSFGSRAQPNLPGWN